MKNEPQPEQQFDLEPVAPAAPMPVARIDPLNQVSDMMKAVVDKGITADNVAAMEQLVGLFERMQNKQNEKDFNAGFVSLQKEMPKVVATEAVPNNDGSIRYTFAPYESIMAQVGPLLVKHGFTVSFSMKYDGPRIIAVCTLRHSAGHAVSNEFAVRIGSGPPKASEAQADGAAGTYAKRMALCNALNIVIEKMDNDARLLADSITKEEALAFKRRVMDTGSDHIKFLEFAQAKLPPANATNAQLDEAYCTIPKTMVGALDASLRKKEKTS